MAEALRRSFEPDEATLRELTMNGLSLALGGANVIMQLSRLEVGHGVAESTVTSGSLHEHPIKRTRTSLGYIMIALFGTDAQRDVVRAEVGRQHRAVRSGPDSPLAYDAFDPELQLWVAACMWRGLLDAVTFLYGVQPASTLDALYARAARFATTLQVPTSMWPVDRAAFDDYWDGAMSHVAMDDTTRAFLFGVASLDFLPWPARTFLGPLHRVITAGFLPTRFRDELGLSWGPSRQRAFAAMASSAKFVNRALPPLIREFPWNVALWDTRRRIERSRPFV